MGVGVLLAWWSVGPVAPATGAAATRSDQPAAVVFHVAPDGDDAWSGRRPTPTADRSDGPLATLHQAREAIRRLKRAAGGLPGPVTVIVAPGTYFLDRPLVLEPVDSGTASCPVTYRAADGAPVVLSAGRRLPASWHSDDGRLWRLDLPEVKAGSWYFRQLRVGSEQLPLARLPDVDPGRPYTSGYLLDASGSPFGWIMGCLQQAGTWLEYEVNVPADGQYLLRVFYANNGRTNQKAWNTTDMSGRTAVSIDGGPAVPLADLTDTGSFYEGFRWSRSAMLALTRGRHVVRWINVKGGGLSLDAFALCDDPAYEPHIVDDRHVRPPPAGRHLILFQAEHYTRRHGRRVQPMSVERVLGREKPASKDTIRFVPGALPSIVPEAGAEVFVIPEWDWVSQWVRLDRIDPGEGILRISGPNCMKPIRPGNRFYVANVREGLNRPGRWCLDRRSGTLWCWPPASPDWARAEIVAPRLDRVIDLVGDASAQAWVSHIVIEGFTFADTTFTAAETIRDVYHPNDAAVWLRSARHCRIARCTFRDVGGYGVCLALGSTDNAVVGNHIVGAGQGGVHLNGIAREIREPAPRALRPGRNLVAANHIHHLGRFYKHVAGVYVVFSDHNVITHNLIHDVPRYGVSLKFDAAGNHIAFNEIRRTCLETCDTGAIEFSENRSGGNVVDNNLVVDTVGLRTMADGHFRTPDFAWGVYLDGRTSRVTVRNNLIVRHPEGAVMLNGGDDNLIVNNVFIGGDLQGAHLNNYTRQGRNNTFRHNLLCVTDPEASCLYAASCHPEFLTSDYNLFWNTAGAVTITTWPEEGASGWAGWRRAGFDAYSLVADPRFVAFGQDDFRLKPDSPAWGLGVQPIDLTGVGPRGYREAP